MASHSRSLADSASIPACQKHDTILGNVISQNSLTLLVIPFVSLQRTMVMSILTQKFSSVAFTTLFDEALLPLARQIRYISGITHEVIAL